MPGKHRRTGLYVLLLLLLPVFAQAEAYREKNTPWQNYVLRCSGCHDMDGSGSLPGGIPPLPGFLGTFTKDPAGRLYLMHVPGIVASSLNDAQLAELMNYLNDKWGDPQGYPAFTAQEVNTLRSTPVEDVVKYRRELVKRYLKEGMKTADYPWP
ncbi:hypothetical protein JK232_07165 [Nissabacter archeti]|uniref:Cytochrome c domain-containing protein n=1 Tax=Nissabacter archeti TaxID=1917880 RepID=A0ABS5JFF1_9GAMM|nr:hypothetical protein [Nissabacter archeti]MBS0968670.1 hypothetical protein [Nissabacter archeti]